MSRCFWFGHSPDAATSEDDCLRDRYRCRRCGKVAFWHRSVLVEVIRVRSVVMQKRGLSMSDLAAINASDPPMKAQPHDRTG